MVIPLDNVRVASPCEESWDRMMGDARRRSCASCGLHVYNLTAMTRAEATALVSESEGRLCVRYYRRSDGTILTRDCANETEKEASELVRLGVRATAFAGLLAGTALLPVVLPKPVDPHAWIQLDDEDALPPLPRPPATQETLKLAASPQVHPSGWVIGATVASPDYDFERSQVPLRIDVWRNSARKFWFAPMDLPRVSPGLAPEIVFRILQHHWSAVRHFYERAFVKDRSLAGMITLQLRIGPHGDVETAEASHDTMQKDEVRQSIIHYARTWRFPMPAGHRAVDVSYTYVFAPP